VTAPGPSPGEGKGDGAPPPPTPWSKLGLLESAYAAAQSNSLSGRSAVAAGAVSSAASAGGKGGGAEPEGPSARRGDWIGDEPEGRRVPAQALSSSSLEWDEKGAWCDDEDEAAERRSSWSRAGSESDAAAAAAVSTSSQVRDEEGC